MVVLVGSSGIQVRATFILVYRARLRYFEGYKVLLWPELGATDVMMDRKINHNKIMLWQDSRTVMIEPLSMVKPNEEVEDECGGGESNWISHKLMLFAKFLGFLLWVLRRMQRSYLGLLLSKVGHISQKLCIDM